MSSPSAAFYFDLASPLAYFAAERALQVLGNPHTAVEWRPVLASELPSGAESDGWRCEQEGEIHRAELERRAHELGLPALRLPETFPFDSSAAMRVATFARSIGRTVPFVQAAFRQAFAGGHSLQDTNYVLISAAACEMHPRAIIAAIERESLGAELLAESSAAAAAGIRGVPAVLIERAAAGPLIFHGERELERAGEALRAGPEASSLDAEVLS